MTLDPRAADVWRRYNIRGVPASDLHRPDKTEVLAWAVQLEALVEGFQAGGGVVFGTLAGANANLGYEPRQMAWVMLDPVAGNNGVYQKSGFSGTGSWSRFGNLPYSFYRADNTGTGTANAIIATNPNPIASTDSLIAFNVLLANTSTNVTVILNGGSPLTIKTSSGGVPSIGGLQPGMIVAGYMSGSQFQMLSDQSSAAIQAACQAAQAAAEAAQALAVQAANLAATTNGGDVPFPSRALAAAATILAAKKYVIVEGYANPGDAAPIMYKRVATQPTHALKFRSQDRFLPNGATDATNGGWWEGALDDPSLVLMPNHFGSPNDGVSYDTTTLSQIGAVLQLGRCKRAKFKGVFSIWQTAAEASAMVSLIALSGIDGLTIEFQDATFVTNAGQLTQVAGVNWAASVFHFFNCKNLRCIGRPNFVGDLTFVAMQAYASAFGTIGLYLEGNCSGYVTDGAEGSGILCPFYVACDTSTVMAATEKPIIAVAGTGYTAGQTLSLPGAAAGATAATMTIDAVDGSGGVKGLSWSTLGNYPEGTLPIITGAVNGYALSGGGGTGARAYIYMQRAVDTEHTTGGNSGFVRARNCFYPYVQRDSGDKVISEVDAEFCYRSTFVYGGIIAARNHTTLRHIYRTGVIFGAAYHALGNKDCYFHVTMRQATLAGQSSGDVICRPTFNEPNPTRVSVHIDVDLDYGAFGSRAANFLEINKYDLGVPDDRPRGHDLKLKWTGRIKGKSDHAAGAPAGTHFSMAGHTWTGEHFGGWEIGPLDIEGGGDIIIDPRAFPNIGLPTDPAFVNTKGGIHFDVVNPDGYVTFNDSLTGTLYKTSNCAISVSPRSRFKNRFGTAGTVSATIGCIEDNGDLTLLPGWQDFTIRTKEAGSGAVTLRTLPSVPIKGQRYTIVNTAASGGTRVRIVPPSPFGFSGHAVTKYLELDLGASATIECTATQGGGDSSNVWSVISSYGTLTYQP